MEEVIKVNCASYRFEENDHSSVGHIVHAFV